MALFTDGPITSIEELSARDSQLLAVASAEGIDVTQKLTLAQDEIALEVLTLLGRLSSAEQQLWVMTRLQLENVVVTPALKLWHAWRALELVYGDAYCSQLNDRYAGKRDQFGELARRAYETVVDSGIGIATYAVPKACDFAILAVASLPGAELEDGTYYVTTAWTNGQGEEGSCSAAATVSTQSGTFSVRPGPPPPNATSWNVYAGAAPDELTRQNPAPMRTDQLWVQQEPLSSNGATPGSGQMASYIRAVPRMIQRG